MMAPALVPAMTSTSMPAARNACSTPMWANPRAAPPPNAKPSRLVNAIPPHDSEPPGAPVN
jgi:hypothetical protein